MVYGDISIVDNNYGQYANIVKEHIRKYGKKTDYDYCGIGIGIYN